MGSGSKRRRRAAATSNASSRAKAQEIASVGRASRKVAAKAHSASPRNTKTAHYDITFFEGLFENSPTPMWVYDEKTLQFLAVNKAACQRYGYTKKEFLAMTITEIRPPETVAAMLQKAKEIRRQKKAYTGLWQHRTKKGEVFTAEIHSHRVRFQGQWARLVIAFDVTHRLRLEQEILKREQQLNLFFQQALDGFYFMMLDEPVEWHNAPDKDAVLDYILHHERMVEANDAMLAQYGLSREEFIGRTPADFYAHDLDYARRIWRENLDGKSYLMITDERRADGTQIWIEGHYIPLFNEAGKFIGHFGIQRDITERKKAEEALRQSEERYRIAAENTGQLIYDLDIASGKIHWVGAIEQVSGFLPEEFARIDLSTWESMIHPEDRPKAIQALHESIQNGTPYDIVYRFRHKKGHYIYVEDNGDCLVNAQGKAYRMIGTMKDITERKQIEETLKEQATVLDKVHDAVIIRDFEDRALYWNQSAERIYGYAAEEVIGKALTETLWKRSNINVQYIIHTVQSEGYWSGELHLSQKSGREVVVESRWTLLRDEKGKPKYIVTTDTDITEKKRLEGQFLRAQRLDSLGRLSGSIAHDLNNIFSPIMLSLELLNARVTDEKSRSWLAAVSQSVERGADLVRQILLFSRGSESVLRPVKLTDVLQELVMFLKDTFPKSIEILVYAEDNLPLVMADATQMYQVLLNLAVNARDAMPNGGELSFRLESIYIQAADTTIHIDAKIGRYVVLTVSDTGVGMSPEVLDKIFEPFFTTKEVGKGTGLGLSTVFSIVKHHGGFLNVYSELGKGSAFKIYLPIWSEPQEQPETAAPADAQNGNGEKILVIDDEDWVREATKRALQEKGYTVLTAASGVEALELFKQQKGIMVAIVDITMPSMDGVELVHMLRKLSPTLKIVAASGLLDSERLAALKRENVETFLHKPFELSRLCQLMAELLS